MRFPHTPHLDLRAVSPTCDCVRRMLPEAGASCCSLFERPCHSKLLLKFARTGSFMRLAHLPHSDVGVVPPTCDCVRCMLLEAGTSSWSLFEAIVTLQVTFEVCSRGLLHGTCTSTAFGCAHRSTCDCACPFKSRVWFYETPTVYLIFCTVRLAQLAYGHVCRMFLGYGELSLGYAFLCFG